MMTEADMSEDTNCEPKLDARGKVSKFAGNEFQYIRQVLEVDFRSGGE